MPQSFESKFWKNQHNSFEKRLFPICLKRYFPLFICFLAPTSLNKLLANSILSPAMVQNSWISPSKQRRVFNECTQGSRHERICAHPTPFPTVLSTRTRLFDHKNQKHTTPPPLHIRFLHAPCTREKLKVVKNPSKHQCSSMDFFLRKILSDNFLGQRFAHHCCHVFASRFTIAEHSRIPFRRYNWTL